MGAEGTCVCVYLCVRVYGGWEYVCVHVCEGLWESIVHVCICTYEDKKSPSDFAPWDPLTLFFETESFTRFRLCCSG